MAAARLKGKSLLPPPCQREGGSWVQMGRAEVTLPEAPSPQRLLPLEFVEPTLCAWVPVPQPLRQTDLHVRAHTPLPDGESQVSMRVVGTELRGRAGV